MKSKIYNVICVLFSLMFINSGLNKFFNYIPVPENLSPALVSAMEAMIQMVWLMPLLATAEIIGGLLIIFPRTRALGVLVIFPIMVGILLTHIFIDSSSFIMALILCLILGWMIYENRAKYLNLIK